MEASRSGSRTHRWPACPPWWHRSEAPPPGLPVGAQIIGPLFGDDAALTFAELLGDVVGGYQAPPR